MTRLRPLHLVPLAVATVLAGASFWLLQVNTRLPHAVVEHTKTHTPDYFADDFSITMLDAAGQTQYRINAATMVHYEDDQNIDVTLPAVRAFSPGQPEVTSTGKRGTINGDGSIVDLYDDARVVRAPGAGDPAMEADSQHFRFRVNDDVVQTEKPVKLSHGQSTMTANGMIYNNTTREMRLLGQVRGMIAASELSAAGAPSR